MTEARIACRTDKSTLANIDAFTYKHLSLSLTVDFESSTLKGTATWMVDVARADVSELVLDTSSGLAVTEASVNGVRVEHVSKPVHTVFGTPVGIPIPAELREAGRELSVKLSYSTAPECSALQWLPPAQTAGKVRPYMFSQCQAIHARALLPCPDAPTAKFTYDATVAVPDWATALMSAVSAGAPTAGSGGTRSFTFEQACPVPSYLVAIAVGDLRGVEVGPRSTVWAEPSVVEAAAWEFGETEAFIKTGEELLGVPYAWGRYDVLCMPPSFPYGGMENPCLTFATPTLLAGDRSLANVICHEVAHSWTGNLVTNHTWEHFWLNEGWTRWVENRIQAKIAGGGAKGEELYDFGMQESITHLEDAILTFGKDNPLTALVPPLEGIDPDDAFSAVPYEKGLALLNFLTDVVGGRDAFEAFAKAYIGHFKQRTLTSADFRDFFLEWCKSKAVDASKVDWEAWLTTPGMPVVPKTYPDPLGACGTRLAERWLAEMSEADDSFTSADYSSMDTKIKIHFLETLLARSLAAETPPMTVAALRKMDSLYGLTQSKNAELRVRWQRLCIRHRAAFIVPHALRFVVEVGRMKFVRPIYRELGEWPEMRSQAVETFMANRSIYHPIASKVLANNDLKLTE